MAQNDTDPGDLKLTKEEHDRILERDIIPTAFASSLSQPVRTDETPKVIILAGQPGAGKSRLADRGTDFDIGAVVVDVDTMREFHPSYKDAIEENDRTAADRVQSDAGTWADEVRDRAIEERHNIIIDATFKTPDRAEALCRKFKDNDYEVEIRAMAASKEESIQGITGRYERGKKITIEFEKNKEMKIEATDKEKKLPWQQRWVDPEKIHDPAYEGVLESIHRAESSCWIDKNGEEKKLVDRICVNSRHKKLYDSTEPVKDQEATAALAVKKGREEFRKPEKFAIYHEKNEEIYELISKRGGLKEKENERFLELYDETRQYRTAQDANRGMANPSPGEPNHADDSAPQMDEPERADWAALGAGSKEEPPEGTPSPTRTV